MSPAMVKNGLEHLSCKNRIRDLELLILGKTGLRGISSACTSEGKLSRAQRQDFQWCPVTGPGHTLRHRRFSLNTRKIFFTVKVTEHFPRLPQEVMEPVSLETLKSCLGTVLGNWLLCGLAGAGWLDKTTPTCAF